MVRRNRKQWSALALLIAVNAAAARGENQIVTFRQGINGYAGEQDTPLNAGQPDAFRGNMGTEQLFTDYFGGTDPNQSVSQTLIRFDGLPVGVSVISATLAFTTGGGDMPGYGARFYRMLQPWSAADTYNEWVGGVQPNGVEAPTTPSFQLAGTVGQGSITWDVTADVKAWAAGQANYGWVTNPFNGRDNGWAFFSGLTYGAGNRRPLLTVTYGVARLTQVWTDKSNNHQWNTTSGNFQTAGTPSIFAAGDYAVFNDFAGPGHSTVQLNAPLAAGRVLVNSSAHYAFTGTSAVTGTLGAALSKIGSGTLTLSNASSHDFRGGVSVFEGTLQVDLNAIPSRKNQIAPASNLLMGNGILKILGSSSGTSSQTFSALAIHGGAARIVIDNNGGPGTILTFDSLARVNGGTLDVAPIPAGSVVNASFTAIGGYATYNQTDWLNSSGAGITPGPVGPLTSYVNNAWTGGNTNVLASANFSVNSVTRSLRFNEPTDITLTFTNATASGSITAGGILVTPNVGAHNLLITGGRITSNNAKDIIIHQYNSQGTLTITSLIYPDPENDVGNQGITVTGPGTVVVTNPSNSYPGPVTINGATLSVASINIAGSPSALGSSSGVIDNLRLHQGTLRYTGPQAVSDRLFMLGSGGGTIEASGTGALLLVGPGDIGFSHVVSTQLTLAGTNVGGNLMAVNLIDPDSTHQYALSVLKAGPGKWIFSANNSFTGGITIQQGTLELGNAGTSGLPGTGPIVNNGILSFNRSNAFSLTNAISGTGSIVKSNSGIATLSGPYSATGPITVNAGKLAIGTTTAGSPSIKLKTSALTIAANATLDLSNNPLILQSNPLVANDKADKLFLLRTNLALGFNNGNWLGKGITSATVAADQSSTGSHLTALALYDNAILNLSTFAGQSVDTSSLFITTALIGDSNFDNVVDQTDFDTVVSHWQTSQTNWTTGDLNYDGFVDLLDAVMVAQNMGQQMIPPVPTVLQSFGTVSVPEPGTLAILLAATGLLTRRRSRHFMPLHRSLPHRMAPDLSSISFEGHSCA